MSPPRDVSPPRPPPRLGRSVESKTYYPTGSGFFPQHVESTCSSASPSPSCSSCSSSSASTPELKNLIEEMLRPVVAAITKPTESVATGERAIMMDLFKIAMQRVKQLLIVLLFCPLVKKKDCRRRLRLRQRLRLRHLHLRPGHHRLFVVLLTASSFDI